MKILIAAESSKQQLALSLLAPPPVHMIRNYREAEDAILSMCRAGERNDPYQAAVVDMQIAGWSEVALFVADLRRDMGWRCELIFVSESDDLGQRIEAAQLGAAAYLVWPAQAEYLPQLIKALEG
jgi:hypothetical protein